eukprot:1158369-Pelagomonas_calceolata.AAC.4
MHRGVLKACDEGRTLDVLLHGCNSRIPGFGGSSRIMIGQVCLCQELGESCYVTPKESLAPQ